MPVRVLKKKNPPVRGKNGKISTSLVLSSMHLCDFALVSQPPTRLQPRSHGWLLGRGGLASSYVNKYSVVNSVHAVVDCCTLCTIIGLVVKRMHCILCTRHYRILYAVYKGTPS